MSSGLVDNERPPYVVFERRAMENKAETIKAGHYVGQDVDIAIITRPGSRDNLEKIATEWLADIREKARQDLLPQTWYDGFSRAYESWLKGEEVPIAGTAIKGWPVLSPSAQKTIIAAGIRTVEDLAELPEAELSRIGTGALSFKQKAQNWLKAANDVGKVTEQLTAMTVQIAELTNLAKAQAEEIKTLRAAGKAA